MSERAPPDELSKLAKSGCLEDVFRGDLRESLARATAPQYNLLATQMLYISRTWKLVRPTNLAETLGKQRLEL